jgi:organic radical activating enzyme
MTYSVKEAFYTLQGEGAQTGRSAVFRRMQSVERLEKDRASAVCTFCDTDFVGVDGDGGGKFASGEQLAMHVASLWKGGPDKRYVLCTGGEPLLQLDEALIEALHAERFEIAIESNSLHSISGTSSCSRWMGLTVSRIPRLASSTVSNTRNGASACRRTSVTGIR